MTRLRVVLLMVLCTLVGCVSDQVSGLFHPDGIDTAQTGSIVRPSGGAPVPSIGIDPGITRSSEMYAALDDGGYSLPAIPYKEMDQRYVKRDAKCDVGAFEFNDFTKVTITIDPNTKVDAATIERTPAPAPASTSGRST